MARLHPLVRQRRDRLSVPGLPAHKAILRDAAAAVANPPAQTKPPPVQRHRWGFNFQVVPTTLSGTRCLPMVPLRLGAVAGVGAIGQVA